MTRSVLRTTAAVPLLWGLLSGCDRGGQGATGQIDMDIGIESLAKPEPSLPAVVVDPDDLAFGEGDPLAGAGGPNAADRSGLQSDDQGPEFTVKGFLKSVDPDSGLVVLDQLLADGHRHDVRFWTDGQTQIGWSKASMKMGLSEIPKGATMYVTYQVAGEGMDRRNHAKKIIIPGGMEDVAKMILGDPEKQSSAQEKHPKAPKKR